MGVMMKNKSSLGLSVADFFWSGCVVAPLVVTYWRGTWDLLEDWVSQVPIKNFDLDKILFILFPGVPRT